MSELTTLLTKLSEASGNVCKAAEGVKPTDVTKDNNAILDEVITKLQSLASDLGGSSTVFVQAYDEFMSGSLVKYLELSRKIGGDVQTVGDLVQQAFQAQRAFLANAAECKQPDQALLEKLCLPTSEKIAAIQELREKSRSSPFFNHLSMISDGIPSLGWVTVSPKPAPYIKEMGNAGQFYSNRVIKDFKGKDETHVEWCRAFMKIFTEMENYVRKYHVTGLTWNKQGKAAETPSGGAPPPPPPPPAVDISVTDAPASGGSDVRSALFASLNKGEGVTTGLKKVTDDMKTHKNPALRQGPKPFLSGPKPYKPVAPVSKAPAPAAKAPKKPPKFELEAGKKWVVEYQDGNKNIVIDNTSMKQTVYIFKCTNSTIQVKGKVNSIYIDNCKKVAVVLESVVASVDLINSQSIQVQVTDKTPIVNIDKTDGAMVYLSENCKDAQIVTAKSSEMNILLPQENGEYKEFAVPEQFMTVFDGKRLVTTHSESLG